MSVNTPLQEMEINPAPESVPRSVMPGIGGGSPGFFRSGWVKLAGLAILILGGLLLYLRFFSGLVGDIHREKNLNLELARQIEELELAVGERGALLTKSSLLEQELVEQIRDHSAESDVLNLLAHLQPIALDLGVEVVEVENRLPSVNRYFRVQPVQIKLRGTYQQVMEFMEQLEQTVALFSVTGMGMENHEYLADRTVLDVQVSGVYLLSSSQDYINE